ncbi:MAG: vWA domain-containing protein [Steroidobacteraceae bacterium]
MLTRTATGADELGPLLRARLAGFAGFLRANGFGVGGADALGLLEASQHMGILDPQVLRLSLKALLCGRGDEWRRFDGLFDAYFLPPNKRVFTEGNIGAAGTRDDAGRAPGGAQSQIAPGTGSAVAGDLAGSARHGASREESLASADFRELNQAQHAYDMEKLMRRFAKRLKRLRLRREAAHHHGRRLDLQSTIRHSVSCGGTPIRLAWKERRRVRPRLVLLVDVSRSMSQYSFFYMRLARALCAQLKDVYCFIFHTRITDVGSALGDPDPWRAQERLHLLAIGWAGGTRIGECLRDFNRDHGQRLLHARTGVIVVSDGYDTGEPALLAQSLAALRRRSRRLVWLNPLLNQPGYAPESRGMRAAMPHIDLLAAGADLASLEQVLPRILETLR